MYLNTFWFRTFKTLALNSSLDVSAKWKLKQKWYEPKRESSDEPAQEHRRWTISVMSAAKDDAELASLSSQLSAFNSNPLDRSSIPLDPFSRLSNSYNITSPTASQDAQTLEEMKSITYWQGVALVIGRQIGGGIFSIPALVNGNAGSVGLSLIFWIFCGLVAYSGACTSRGYLSNRSVVCRIGVRNSTQWRCICVSRSSLRSLARMFIHVDNDFYFETCVNRGRCNHFWWIY